MVFCPRYFGLENRLCLVYSHVSVLSVLVSVCAFIDVHYFTWASFLFELCIQVVLLSIRGLTHSTRSLCKQWVVRIAAGSGLSRKRERLQLIPLWFHLL